MDEKEILRNLGLTKYESDIVLALLPLGASKVSDIKKQCNVPKNKIYESLGNLSRKGIVQIIPTIPKKYFIRNIDSFKILIKQKEENLEQLRKEISRLKKIREDKVVQAVNEPISII